MADFTSLKISKIGDSFLYFYDGNVKAFSVSKGYVNYNNQTDKIQIVEYGRAVRPKVLVGNVSVQVDGGAVQTGFSWTTLENRAREINCPLFIDTVIGGVDVPTLTEVLAIGNRNLIFNTDNTYIFTSSDKTKYIAFIGDNTQDVTIKIDDSLFGVGDELTGVSGIADYNLIIDNTDGYVNPVSEVSFTLPLYTEFSLRKVEDGSWILTVKNYELNTGGGATDLGYTPSATNGVVTSSTGTDATIPLADGTNAGLSENNFTDTEKTNLANQSGTNTGDNATNSTSNTYADAKVQNSLTASTTVAPSATAVNDALSLKADNSLFLFQQVDRVLTSNTSAQNIFDVGVSGSGAITLLANSTYHFELEMSMSGLSTTSGQISLSFDAGTANITLFKANVMASKAALNNNSTMQHTFLESTATNPIVNASTVASAKVFVSGVLVCTTSGTFIPRVSMSVASASSVKAGTHLKMERLGSNSVTHYPTS